MKKIVSIEGMMCEHCQKRVLTALENEKENVTVSLEENSATLIDPKISDERITEIINELGFEVVGIKNE